PTTTTSDHRVTTIPRRRGSLPAARGGKDSELIAARRATSAAAFLPASAPDYLSAAQLRELQLQRLQAMVGRAYDRVALFRRRMDERGLTPDISSRFS
ncbi:MAG: hypothetical protein R6U27_00835, partial [Desulfobacterales bacterium]